MTLPTPLCGAADAALDALLAGNADDATDHVVSIMCTDIERVWRAYCRIAHRGAAAMNATCPELRAVGGHWAVHLYDTPAAELPFAALPLQFLTAYANDDLPTARALWDALQQSDDLDTHIRVLCELLHLAGLAVQDADRHTTRSSR